MLLAELSVNFHCVFLQSTMGKYDHNVLVLFSPVRPIGWEVHIHRETNTTSNLPWYPYDHARDPTCQRVRLLLQVLYTEGTECNNLHK